MDEGTRSGWNPELCSPRCRKCHVGHEHFHSLLETSAVCFDQPFFTLANLSFRLQISFPVSSTASVLGSWTWPCSLWFQCCGLQSLFTSLTRITQKVSFCNNPVGFTLFLWPQSPSPLLLLPYRTCLPSDSGPHCFGNFFSVHPLR